MSKSVSYIKQTHGTQQQTGYKLAAWWQPEKWPFVTKLQKFLCSFLRRISSKQSWIKKTTFISQNGEHSVSIWTSSHCKNRDDSKQKVKNTCHTRHTVPQNGAKCLGITVWTVGQVTVMFVAHSHTDSTLAGAMRPAVMATRVATHTFVRQPRWLDDNSQSWPIDGAVVLLLVDIPMAWEGSWGHLQISAHQDSVRPTLKSRTWLK